jgi:hypothetical protein
MGRIALGAIPMIGVVAGSAAEIAGYVSMFSGLVMGLASRGIDAPLSSELFFGGVLGIVAGSTMGHAADKGCHMVRRIFGNTESHAEAVERAGRHTSSLIEYLINKLDR